MEQKNIKDKNGKISSKSKEINKRRTSFPPVKVEEFLDEGTKKRLLELKNYPRNK